MTVAINFEKHITFTSIPDIKAICAPLFDVTEITAFVHARIFDNGEVYGLNSHEQWQRHHFEQQTVTMISLFF